jgi:hypothetical protein
LLGHEALVSEVSHFSAAAAWKAMGGKLLWWPDCRLL